MANSVIPPGGVPESPQAFAIISAENTWSAPLSLDAGQLASVSVRGSFDATVVVQRQIDGQNWAAVPNSDGSVGWTGPTEQTYEADEACWLRIGIDTGDYVSGEAQVRLGKG